MPLLHHLVLALAVIGTSCALPSRSHSKPHSKHSGAFKIDQVPRPRAHVKNGPASYHKTLRKYGAVVDTIDVAAKAAKVGKAGGNATASSVSAIPDENDVEYTCPVTIGNQVFLLDLDTGSSDLWVLGKELSSAASGSNHTFYNPGANATAIDGSSWKISYGDGSTAAGKVFSDTVTIGNTTVIGQAVESASSASKDFISPQAAEDGLLGLGFDDINTVRPKPVKTFLSTAVDQGLPQALFTSLLKKGEPGAYTFGMIDESQYTGEIVYTDVDSSNGFWSFSPTSYSVAGTKGSANPSALTGIADTGTTLLLIDDSIVEDYYQHVESADLSTTNGGWVFDCSSDLPDFTLTIEDYVATIPGNFINFAPNPDGTCYGGIQGNQGIGFAIYGDIFLKSQFVVFDRTQATPRLGFAAQA